MSKLKGASQLTDVFSTRASRLQKVLYFCSYYRCTKHVRVVKPVMVKWLTKISLYESLKSFHVPFALVLLFSVYLHVKKLLLERPVMTTTGATERSS